MTMLGRRISRVTPLHFSNGLFLATMSFGGSLGGANGFVELSYGTTVALEQSIDRAYATTTSKLVDLMTKKFGLWDHLNAFKKYILLGQGDFIALLMESIGYQVPCFTLKSPCSPRVDGRRDSLDRPANTLYRHNLTATLESAIRGSNAQFDSPEILRRLDARMLELSHGELGWDVFTLEYKIEPPLNVIVTPKCAREYLKVCNLPQAAHSRLVAIVAGVRVAEG